VAESDAKPKPCLIACSVLKDEIQRLIKDGKLNADVIFVSKNFHVDYSLLEKNLRKTIERTLPRFPTKPILVYGDLCLGPNGEMKQLTEEFGLRKVDALNCLDCLLGGHGEVDNVDPNHEHMFFYPGMIDFFRYAKKKLRQEGMTEDGLKNLFSGVKGVVLLDTLGNAETCLKQVEELRTGLEVLETKKVGLGMLLQVIQEVIRSK
jgi:hypothetical protein